MIWLSISLFCRKKYWNNLLANCINPFIKNHNLQDNWRMEFNYFCGENLRVAFLTEEENAVELSRLSHQYFNNYFKQSYLQTVEERLPIDGIFMPFPDNSIQFGLYPPQAIDVEEIEGYRFSINLSNAILEAFTEEVDDETILTFAFYLQISIIKGICSHLEHSEDVFSIIDNYIDETNTDEKNRMSHGSEMDEITGEVMGTDLFKGELRWLNHWIEYTHTIFDASNGNSKSGTISSHYQYLVNIMHDQLGVNIYGRTLLSQWINASLKKNFKENITGVNLRFE